MAYRSDNLKKMFCWTSPKEKEILGAALKCRAAGWKKTESALIEDALNALLLPQNKSARFVAASMFDQDSLALAFESVFHLLEAGVHGVDAAAPNGRPLVEAFRDMVFINMSRHQPNKNSGDIKYIASKFSSIADYVKESDPLTGQYMADLIDDMKRDPEFFSYFNIVSAILQTWDLIGNKSLTYRVLAALVRLCPVWVDDNDLNRNTFLDILNEVSREW